MEKLSYKSEANKWERGLLIGNGKLAAILWEKEQRDILSLNHEQLWSGITRDRQAEDNARFLPVVRECLKAGKFFEATALANLFFGGKDGISEMPYTLDTYIPAGNLVFEHSVENPVTVRSLDIETGVADSKRRHSVLQCFADCHSTVIACQWTGDNLCGELIFEREEDKIAEYSYKVSENRIGFHCRIKKGITFCVQVDFITDGKVSVLENGISLCGATQLTCTTDIVVPELNSVKGQAAPDDYDGMLCAHTEKFSALMNRTSLALVYDKAGSEFPTDERIERVRNGAEDVGLQLLYFDYGRYLLLSSNICAKLPANLQGKWNLELKPPWESDYHMDINLQMNYWMASSLGMHECNKILFDYITGFLPSGREAAKRLYGCRGVWIPLQSDAWMKATPEAYGWAAWIGAAPWLAQHLWNHFRYTGDRTFLKETAYPFFKAVAEFYEDYLEKDQEGIYQIMPSQSPENRFEGTGYFPVSIGISSAMDVELAYDALGYAISSSEVLDMDADKRLIWKELRNHLPELKVGSDGRLLEWDSEERVEVEPCHRHVSHLYGLYPSDIINAYDTPRLYEGALASLKSRIAAGGGYTGWSRAWTACLYAKIGDKDVFCENYSKLISEFATDSLLDLHPPRIFQIDGNLGGTAAVVEALVSVSGKKVRLLHALPDSWATGSICGVYIPGGHRLSFQWENSKVTKLTVKFGFESKITFIVNGKELTIRKEKEVINIAF